MENLNEIEKRKFERAQKHVKAIAGYYKHLISYVLVNLFLISLNYFKLEPGEEFFKFSTFSVAFFWGIGLAFHTVSVFGKNVFLGQEWEEKKINELMNKKQHNKWE
ncbi:2TM domain-containing protein [Flavobacterium sp. PLA-1-15]|uniref:2TM domain-containing protein n=1 Tax=Flavobacterium sp. PLA-1-15 TaxID=3380533 RepID=UPI003B81DE3D